MNPPPIPPRSSSKPAFLLPQESIERIREKRSRIVSTSNAMSGLSTVSNVSDYLEKKLLSLQSEAEYHQCVQEELRHAKSTEILDAQDYDSQMESVDEELKPIWSEVRVLKRQKRLTEQEMEDNVQIIKRRNLNIAPSIELLERAYTTTMLTRVMSACKQKKRNFNQSQFRKDVIERYDAAFLKSHGGYALVWCHLTEWHPPEVIKAAHLVPKNLRGGELLHIFGEDEVVLSDPANGKSHNSRVIYNL